MDELIRVSGGMLLAAFLIFIGYLMGFKAARPDDKLITREFNPGSTDEPEGDIWQDAMKDDKDERISTI